MLPLNEHNQEIPELEACLVAKFLVETLSRNGGRFAGQTRPRTVKNVAS
jgi:hypothetical protein